MANEIIIDFKNKKNFQKDGIEFKFTKDSLQIQFGKIKNSIRITKDSISYGHELTPIIDPRKYSSSKTISLDFDGLKELMEKKVSAAREQENFKNAVKAKEMLLNLYVRGKFLEIGIEIDDCYTNLRTDFYIYNSDDYCFHFNYKDSVFINLDFDKLKITENNSEKVFVFSEFLKTTAPKLKQAAELSEQLVKLNSEIETIFEVECNEFEDNDDDAFF